MQGSRSVYFGCVMAGVLVWNATASASDVAEMTKESEESEKTE